MDLRGQQTFVEDVHRLQVIKCVLVGDRAVGKSHLVCAKMCGMKYALRELVQMHISTVWAIDHYRSNSDVQRRSICTVECVTCSLRLWDTFGNHEKDRQFAYSSADVILACFSVADRRSLDHIETHWMPEVHRMCGNHIPVVLCACKIDMRYLYNDPAYMDLAKAASQRRLSSEDIVLPDEGKAVAKRIGAFYYETSVLVQYGIDEVFSNCIRAALISKRRGKILVGLGSLKSVVRPHLQVPHMPPRPPPPGLSEYEGRDVAGLDAAMVGNGEFTDVVFLVQGKEISAHCVFLIAASAAFQSYLDEMFGVEAKSSCCCPSSNLESSLTCSQVTLTNNFDAEGTIDDSEADTGISDGDLQGACSWSRSLSHDSERLSHGDSSSTGRFSRQFSMSAQRCRALGRKLSESSWLDSTRQLLQNLEAAGSEKDSGFNLRTPTASSSCLSSVLSHHSTENGKERDRVTIAVDESVTPSQFRTVLRFLYTGDLPEDLSGEAFMALKRVARLFGLDDMDRMIANILNEESFLNLEIKRKFRAEKSRQISSLFLGQDYFSDVSVEVDDGLIRGHLALLSARCDVLLTMFSSEFFSERSTGRVRFPGVGVDAFLGVLEYLYTGKCPSICRDWVGLLDLCDRFFLPDLLKSAEVVIIKELMAAMEAGVDVVEMSLDLLGPATLHGAKQLVKHCTWILKVNYKDLIERDSSVLETFDHDLQSELTRERWPPIWYLKEVEIYEKALLEMNKLRPQQSWLRRSDGEACISPGGCLSFWKRKA